MASTSSTLPNPSSIFPLRCSSHQNRPLPLQFSLSVPHSNPPKTSGLVLCGAAKSQTGPVSKKSSRSGGVDGGGDIGDGQSKTLTFRRRSDIDPTGGEGEDDVPSGSDKGTSQYQSTPLPKPPAGFVLDAEGRVLTASRNRIVTLVDPDNNNPLDCIARRVFRSSRGDECMLVYPVDMPISILKSANFEGWAIISDEEIEAVLPTADYILAKTHMHLVYSGFCYTARGGFTFNESDLFNLEDGATEALGIACFHLDGAHYMIYTTVDPLNLVIVKDGSGAYQLADDELLEDPAVLSAVDEETEFNALVQAEDAALVEILNNGGI